MRPQDKFCFWPHIFKVKVPFVVKFVPPISWGSGELQNDQTQEPFGVFNLKLSPNLNPSSGSEKFNSGRTCLENYVRIVDIAHSQPWFSSSAFVS